MNKTIRYIAGILLILYINDRFNGIDEVTLLLLANLFRLGLALL